jgi:hypothetical protein
MEKRSGDPARPLGRLETMYYLYYKHDIDYSVQMVRLRCVQCVQLSEVRKAMKMLQLQHPALRMFITERKDPLQFHFVEMNPLKIDCKESYLSTENLLQEELNTKFDSSGPLWRITVQRLQNDVQKNGDDCSKCRKRDGFQHQFSFALSFHHSLVDGVYMLKLLADFVELLDEVQKNEISMSGIHSRNFPSPIEHYLPAILCTDKAVAIPKLCTTSLEALAAYNQCFLHEINRLRSNPVQAMAMRTKLVQTKTQQFFSQCKLQGILVSGAIVAASCIAFAKQVELAFGSQVKELQIPVEVMVDMRRYATSVKDFTLYPGTAAIHLPFLIKIPLHEHLDSKELFWQIARKSSDDLYQAIHSTKPITFMKEEVENEINSINEDVVGKSPYVLCISNVSTFDNIVRPRLRSRFQLKGAPNLSLIGIDNHPIFQIVGFSVVGELHFLISYCNRYTSRETASRFSWNVTKTIQNVNML